VGVGHQRLLFGDRAAIVPIVATSFGLTAVLMVAGVAYLVAMPAFFAVLLPIRRSRVSHESVAVAAT
jgi:hypothetical protein